MVYVFVEQVFVICVVKEKGIQVMCEVLLYYLFLIEDDVDRIGGKRYGVKLLFVMVEDQKVFWDNFDVIDCFVIDYGKC